MLIFLTLLWVGRVTAQVTETGGGDVQQALNTVFQNVDMSQVPTGLLMSKSIYFTNVDNYCKRLILYVPLSKNIKIPP